MRILNIDIENYRQYQSLSFKFPEPKDNDIHIIIAQNGVGKTNLLNAITWCLYGKEPHLGDDNKDLGLPKINLSALDEARRAGNNTVTVVVEIRAQDNNTSFTYKRSLPFRITNDTPFEETAREIFTVTVATSAGDPKVYEGKEAMSFVDRYMPEKIREYFYFDGEQLNNYFISARKGKVHDAIFSISQVDIVNLIYNRIGELIKEKQREAASKAPDIKKINDDLTDIETQIQTISNKIIDLEDQIAKSERIIKENTEYLQGEDNLPELEKQYQELKEKQAHLTEERKELFETLYSFVREMKTTLTFYPAAKKTLEIIESKEAAKELPPNIDVKLLQKALNDHICVICNQSLSNSDENFIKKLIESIPVSSTLLQLNVNNRIQVF